MLIGAYFYRHCCTRVISSTTGPGEFVLTETVVLSNQAAADAKDQQGGNKNL
jgi:hypothetical protein